MAKYVVSDNGDILRDDLGDFTFRSIHFDVEPTEPHGRYYPIPVAFKLKTIQNMADSELENALIKIFKDGFQKGWQAARDWPEVNLKK